MENIWKRHVFCAILKMMNRWIFDRYGIPQLRLLENGSFVSRNGQNIGYIKDGEILYNYRGKHCGWINGGILRDRNGLTVGFMKGGNDYPSPIFPIPQIPQIPFIPQIAPIPFIPQIPSIKPLKHFGWSVLFPLTLFQ